MRRTMGFPTSPESLGPAELTEYLRNAGLLAGGQVIETCFEFIGGGKMGDNGLLLTAYRQPNDKYCSESCRETEQAKRTNAAKHQRRPPRRRDVLDHDPPTHPALPRRRSLRVPLLAC